MTEDGQQIIVRVVHPGDLLRLRQGLAAVGHRARRRIASFSAGRPRYGRNSWNRTRALPSAPCRRIGQRLEEAHTRIREMSTQEVERRVAHAILRLSHHAGRKENEGIRIEFPIFRQDIAEMTGTTLHTVSRILSAWESRGLVEGGRQKLLIRDLGGLSALAEGARD